MIPLSSGVFKAGIYIGKIEVVHAALSRNISFICLPFFLLYWIGIVRNAGLQDYLR